MRWARNWLLVDDVLYVRVPPAAVSHLAALKVAEFLKLLQRRADRVPAFHAEGLHAIYGVVPVVRLAEHFHEQTGGLHGHEVVHEDVIGHDGEVAFLLDAEFLRHFSRLPAPARPGHSWL